MVAGLIYIFIINIIIIFCQFRLVSPRSYIGTLKPTSNKFHKQTKKQTNSKFDMRLKNVRCACFRSDGWQGNYNKKIWKVARVSNDKFLRSYLILLYTCNTQDNFCFI